jgi:hypothetical protein
MPTMQSILKGFKDRDVSLQEVSSGYRISTRDGGDLFNVWAVDDDIVWLQSDSLHLRKVISLRSIVEIEIVLDAERT